MFVVRCHAARELFACGREPFDEVDALIREFYAMDGNGAGGNLHNVLDDSNLGDGSIDWCIEYARKEGDTDAVALGELLRAMTLRQRLEVPACICPCGCTNEWREQVGLPPVEPSIVAEELPGGGMLIRGGAEPAPSRGPRFEVTDIQDGIITLRRKEQP